MLRIIVPGAEFFNEITEKFSTVGDIELSFEHSLLSLSKWESEYQKPFLTQGNKTPEEILGYIRAMLISGNLDQETIARLTKQNLDDINAYINSKESATTFKIGPKERANGEIVTAELIYYWMTTFGIPFDCERWHLNRLFALIRICSIKQSKPEKMSRSELAQRNHEINAQRRAQLGTRG